MSWITEKNLAELRGNAAGLVADAGKILENATTENRDVTAEERERFDSLHAEAKKLGDKIKTLEEQHQAERTYASRIGREDFPAAKKDVQRYSLLRAFRKLAEPGGRLDGIEKEVSDELAHRAGKEPQGFYIPGSMPTERNALDLTAGAGAIELTVHGDQFIDLLRAKTLLNKLNVTWLGGLIGDCALPKETGGATVAWVTDGNAPSGSNQTIQQVIYRPSTAAVYTDISRKFLKQSSIDAEMLVRNDLAKQLAVEVDRVAFNGSGVGAQPLGLLQNSSVPVVSLGSNGAAPTWASIVAMEASVESYSALLDVEAGAYVTSPSCKGTLKTTPRAANYPSFIWEDDEINGYKAFATANMPSNLTKSYGTGLSAIIFGDWSQLVVAQWGAVDAIVDPYTGSSSGTLRIVLLQDMNVAPRHAESFCNVVDAVT